MVKKLVPVATEQKLIAQRPLKIKQAREVFCQGRFRDPLYNPRAVTGAATAVVGVISTRRGNAASWVGIIGMQTGGTWTLDLSAPASAALFQNSEVQNILFVITYSASLPPWPD